MVHHFAESKKLGVQGEQILDGILSQHCRIVPATWEQQHQGIDRVVFHRGVRLFVEYKTDLKGDRSGNVFIETASSEQRQGWASRSKSGCFDLPTRPLWARLRGRYATTTGEVTGVVRSVSHREGEEPGLHNERGVGADRGVQKNSRNGLHPLRHNSLEILGESYHDNV
jgi:hypothetical protein